MTALGKIFRTTAFRLSLAYLVIFSIGAGIILARVAWTVNGLVDEQIAQTIDAEINGLSEQYSQGGVRQLVNSIDRRAGRPGSSLYLLTTSAGETIAGNIEVLPGDVLQRPGIVETPYQRTGETVARNLALARIFRLPGGFRLLVGRDLDERSEVQEVMGRALLTSLLWFIAIGTLGGLFVANRVLRRVDAMNASAHTIMTGDLSRRLPIAGTGDELDRLALNLNAMLDRIAVLMAGLREVSDNIAHDLKTPLTRLRNRAEEALRIGSSTEDYRAALEKTIEESDQLIRIFNGLLMIARAEAGPDRSGMMEFDVSSVARDVTELYEPVAEEEGASIDLDTAPGLEIEGNRELIGQAVANLLDNALKYGVAVHSTDAPNNAPALRVSARRIGANVEIEVSDHGPGIAAADRARVLDRFVRLEGSRSRPGSGLGLSLAAAVARLHGGQLRIEDNEPGLRVILSLPALPMREIMASLVPQQLPPPIGHGDGTMAKSPASVSR